ncbi:sensor histidine kinase [Agrobacterium sp. NPDC089420]|uniref:sensor histidine kinase n=1 Tax=Agrobacterium sp. NPDC089420 TaxID=3363918 RepID=UPI00384D6A1A
MKRSSFWPSSMTMQIFLLSAVPLLILTLSAVLAVFFSDVKRERMEWANVTSAQLLLLADGVRAAGSDEERDAAFEAITRAGFSASLRDGAQSDAPPGFTRPGDAREHLGGILSNLASQNAGARMPSLEVTIVLDKSRWLVFEVPAPSMPASYWVGLRIDLFWIGLMVAPVLALSLYTSFTITRRLADFSRTVQKASLDDGASDIFVTGNTSELLNLADSFNTMRARVNRVVEQRAEMLRAMGHDLRTPLTRLRMRIECCADTDLQRRMLGDLDTVTAMIDDSMSYLKDMALEGGLAHKADLSSLLQTVVAGFADMGVSVSFSGPARLPLLCKSQLLARAVSNLIDNATRYADIIEVLLIQESSGEIIITVNDDGPGIANDMKLKLMEPFFKRGQVRDHGGVGFGLAIAHGVARLHGGALSLHDRHPHGLSARLMVRSLSAVQGKSADDVSLS